MSSSTVPDGHLVIPAESLLLKENYKKSGLTVADLAGATGLSVGTIHIAMSGIRYRDGKPRVAVPPDRTLVRLSSVLHIDPNAWRQIGRDRAADLLVDVNEAGEAPIAPVDIEAVSAVAGRGALARQVLAVFSTAELQAEVKRRDRIEVERVERAEHDRLDREANAEIAEDLRTEQWPL